MTKTVTVVARPRSRESALPVTGFGLRPLVPALASALLLWLSFPPADCGYLAWFALAPLFGLVRSDRSRRALYTAAWIGGEVFWLLAIEWVRRTDPSAWLGWVVMATFLALWWPAFLALARLAVRRLRLPLFVAAPVIWLALDYVRAYVLTGFPWYYLAHAQHAYLPMIQISDLAGAWGLTLLIAIVNAWWVDLLTQPLIRGTARGPRLTPAQAAKLAVVVAALFATVSYGFFRLQTARFREGPRLALLQSNFDQSLKNALDSEQVLARYAKLIVKALAVRPHLIVWPETAYPRGFPVFDPKIDERTLTRQIKALNPKGTVAFWKEKQALVRRELNDLVDDLGIPMLVGTISYEFGPLGLSRYNSAILFEPGGKASQCYHKLHLVPFGEYVPLIKTFPWLTRLTPYHGEVIPSLAFGPRPVWFDLNGVRFATAICFEDTVPYVARRFFAEAKVGQPPHVLVNISNDGWFHGSSELDMHLAISVFRAIEHRVPLARAVNTGGTAIIDGNGAILKALPKLTEDVLTGAVPLDDRTTLYSAWGDWLPFLCLAITVGLVPLGWLTPRR